MNGGIGTVDHDMHDIGGGNFCRDGIDLVGGIGADGVDVCSIGEDSVGSESIDSNGDIGGVGKNGVGRGCIGKDSFGGNNIDADGGIDAVGAGMGNISADGIGRDISRISGDSIDDLDGAEAAPPAMHSTGWDEGGVCEWGVGTGALPVSEASEVARMGGLGMGMVGMGDVGRGVAGSGHKVARVGGIGSMGDMGDSLGDIEIAVASMGGMGMRVGGTRGMGRRFAASVSDVAHMGGMGMRMGDLAGSRQSGKSTDSCDASIAEVTDLAIGNREAALRGEGFGWGGCGSAVQSRPYEALLQVAPTARAWAWAALALAPMATWACAWLRRRGTATVRMIATPRTRSMSTGFREVEDGMHDTTRAGGCETAKCATCSATPTHVCDGVTHLRRGTRVSGGVTRDAAQRAFPVHGGLSP